MANRTIGHSQLLDFEKNLPAGFLNTIEREIKTIAATKKGITIGPKVSYDTQLHMLCDFKPTPEQLTSIVFSLILAPVPTALFDDSGKRKLT